MCGIAGFLDFQRESDSCHLRALAEAQIETLRHRGPDDGDVWLDATVGIALAQRRLSIIDLTPAGHQPMVSACGRLVIAYNGEAYNAAELRTELETAGRRLRGRSDTEIVLESCAYWGIRTTLERLNGMFAFALWDRKTRRLFLARDRLGIKPLYWTRTAQSLLFGSELKALRAHPDCPTALDRGAVAAFLRHNYIPAPFTVLEDVHKLRPGCLLAVDVAGTVSEETYWRLEDAVAAGRENPFVGDDEAAADALESLLGDAVGRQMVADVPLGVFLSGGIDSSLVCALMQAHSNHPVHSFSIGFEETGYDETRYANAVARHLGTDHTALTVTAQDARDVIPELPAIYDEPFADSSQIPTLLLARLTRRHVTVALSGDGGDELFAGYTRYFTADLFARRLARVPVPLRVLGARVIHALPPHAWDTAFQYLPATRRPAHAGDRLYKLAAVLGENPGGFYRRLVSHWWKPEDLVPRAAEPRGPVWDDALRQHFAWTVDWMRYLDSITYLPDDILAKVDRASMAVSLESRVPLLDHRVAEFAWRLPRRFLVRDGQGKWLLRRILDRHVPRALVERPKMGFGIPLDSWLRGPLRNWAGDMLSEDSLRRHGLLDPGIVGQAFSEHLSGRRNWQYHLWDVLMLQAWCEHWRVS